MPRVTLLPAAAVCYVLGVCSADAWRDTIAVPIPRLPAGPSLTAA